MNNWELELYRLRENLVEVERVFDKLEDRPEKEFIEGLRKAIDEYDNAKGGIKHE